MITKDDDERFQSGAREYAAYLETPEGRLRTDLAFANLQEFLPASHATKTPCALDIGCGTGAAAIRLARLGFHVTQLDSSQAMLDLARSAAEEAAVADGITRVHADAGQITGLLDAASFDIVLCHNVLEFVEDPSTVLRGVARVLRDTSAMLSIVVRNQAGEVLKAAIQSGDLAAAEANLMTQWAFESLYGGRVRLFTPANIRELLNAASLELIVERGVRVIADYLPSCISREAEYKRIFELEQELGKRSEFAAIARYTQCLARLKIG